MERKKLIRRAALVGLGLLLASGLAAMAAWFSLESGWRRHLNVMDEHVAKLTQEYQAYLDEVAKKINGLPADPRVIGEIQTRHYQERPGRWLYVWASTNTGQFSFGVPADAFARLNAAYDQNEAVIAQDNRYGSRDEFLRTLLHQSVDFTLAPKEPPAERAPDGRRRRPDSKGDDAWRFAPTEERDWEGRERYHRPIVQYFSAPIQTTAGATVGNLNLKLIDIKDARLYWSWGRYWHETPWSFVLPISGFVAVLSAIWLWFLLPSWVYIDARQRGMPRPLIWAALTLFGSAFALMVYLVSRPAELPELRCPQCSKPLNGSKAGCPYCGADLSAAFCAQCQYPLKPDWTFCPSCRSAATKPPAA